MVTSYLDIHSPDLWSICHESQRLPFLSSPKWPKKLQLKEPWRDGTRQTPRNGIPSQFIAASDEMPIKSAWSLKVSSFRYQVLWKISFIPNPSTLQASQVEVKQGLRRRDPDSEICMEWGSRVTVSHAHPTPSCHSKLSTYPLPITYSTPGPDDMCKYLFSAWYPKTESIS